MTDVITVRKPDFVLVLVPLLLYLTYFGRKKHISNGFSQSVCINTKALLKLSLVIQHSPCKTSRNLFGLLFEALSNT